MLCTHIEDEDGGGWMGGGRGKERERWGNGVSAKEGTLQAATLDTKLSKMILSVNFSVGHGSDDI